MKNSCNKALTPWTYFLKHKNWRHFQIIISYIEDELIYMMFYVGFSLYYSRENHLQLHMSLLASYQFVFSPSNKRASPVPNIPSLTRALLARIPCYGSAISNRSWVALSTSGHTCKAKCIPHIYNKIFICI